MKYEIIIFDADETLFDFVKSERDAFKNTMLEFDIDYDENHHLKIYHGINADIWKEFEKGLITQEELKVERFKRLSDKLNAEFDVAQFSKSYMKHLSNASFLYDHSIDLVESLHKDYRIHNNAYNFLYLLKLSYHNTFLPKIKRTISRLIYLKIHL